MCWRCGWRDAETVISFDPPKGVFTTRVWVCVWILEQCECEEGMSVSVPGGGIEIGWQGAETGLGGSRGSDVV